MSQVYTARRRTAQDHTQAAAPAAQERQAAPGLGADAQAFGMGSRLEELMQERMRQHFLDHQIPEAERDTVAASPSADSTWATCSASSSTPSVEVPATVRYHVASLAAISSKSSP